MGQTEDRLDQYTNLVQDVLTVYHSGDAGAMRRLNEYTGQVGTQEKLRAIVQKSLGKSEDADLSLTEAQLFIARVQGFENWKGVEANIKAPLKSINLDPHLADAEQLLGQARSGQPEALKRIRQQRPADEPLEADGIQLADTQLVVAQESGFSDWAKFRDQLLTRDAVRALDVGDYSYLDDLLKQHRVSLVDLLVAAGEPKITKITMEQAFTWACMLGRTSDAAFLLDKGVDPLAGENTGLNGFHYAVWHGHPDTVKLLIKRKIPLEVRNMYGGTVLGCALHGAENQPMPDHSAIIEALLEAGAQIDASDFPTGNEQIDELLRRYRAK